MASPERTTIADNVVKQFLMGQKGFTTTFVRAQMDLVMDQMIGPMVEQLFDKLQNKFDDYLLQNSTTQSTIVTANTGDQQNESETISNEITQPLPNTVSKDTVALEKTISNITIKQEEFFSADSFIVPLETTTNDAIQAIGETIISNQQSNNNQVDESMLNFDNENEHWNEDDYDEDNCDCEECEEAKLEQEIEGEQTNLQVNDVLQEQQQLQQSTTNEQDNLKEANADYSDAETELDIDNENMEYIEYKGDVASLKTDDHTDMDTGRPTKRLRSAVHKDEDKLIESTENNNPDFCVMVKTLQCMQPNCVERFSNKKQLDVHHRRTHGIQKYQCLAKKCTESFDAHIKLNKHIKTAHSKILTWQCSKCTNTFHTYHSLEGHYFNYHLLGQFQCSFPQCDFISGSRGIIRAHVRAHRVKLGQHEEMEHNEEDGLDTSSMSNLTRRSSLAKDSTKYLTHSVDCFAVKCKQKFDNTLLLNDHLKEAHSILRNRCHQKGCNASFPNNFDLARHLESVHRRITEFRCSKCASTFQSHHALKTHFNTGHQSGRFQCLFEGCQFIGTTRRMVYNHHEQTHRQELQCSHCEARFPKKYQLQQHERAHRGIEPFRCKWPGCSYANASQSNTVMHIQRTHFKLRASKKKTKRPNGNPKDYLEVVQDLLD